jgi:hypothetical protein
MFKRGQEEPKKEAAMNRSQPAGRFGAHRGKSYSGSMEVMRMTLAWRVRSLVVVGLVIAIAAASSLPTLAQEEPFLQRVLDTLTQLPAGYLNSLDELVNLLADNDAAREALMESPRDFLATQELVPPIELSRNAFQVTAIDFTVEPTSEEDVWYGVAEPLDGLTFEPKGIGVFYRNVGILIQEAQEPLPDGEATPPATNDVEDMLGLLARLSGDTLERLRVAMKDLNRVDPSDSQRIEFLSNPREYLLGRELTLPASTYRIVAIDFQRAEAVEAVHADEVRAGLATIPEGIGVFSSSVGIFLQLSI